MKRHKPDNITRGTVSALASVGYPEVLIAEYMGLSLKELKSNYVYELKDPKPHADAKVIQFVYLMATGEAKKMGIASSDCAKAAMFWLKSQCGWDDVSKIDVTSNGETVKQPDVIRFVAARDAEEDSEKAIESSGPEQNKLF